MLKVAIVLRRIRLSHITKIAAVILTVLIMVHIIKIQKEFLKRGLFFVYSIAHRTLNTLLYYTRVEHVEVVFDGCYQIVVVIVFIAALCPNLLQ